MARARSLVRVALGLGVSALFLFLLLRRVDPGEFGDAIRSIQAGWLLLAAPIYLAAMVTRAHRWRLVLRPAIEVSLRDATSIVVIGYSANNLLPARVGEVMRAVLLQRRTGASRLTVLGTIVVERVFDGLVLTLFLVPPLALRGSTGTLRALAFVATGIFVTAAVVLALLAARPEPMHRFIHRVLGLAPGRLRPALRAWTASFLSGLSLLRGPRAWAGVALMTTISWTCEAGTYWMVGHAFGLGLDPWLYFGVCGAANLAISAPAAGGVGPYEFFASAVVVAFGVGISVASAYALALHALLLIPTTVAGLALLWREQIGIGALRRQAADASAQARAAESGDNEAPDAPLARAEEPTT